MKITPREKRRHAWGDFHARSRFARSTIPEEKWGTTRSLGMSKTIVDDRHINYNFFPRYIRCFHYTFSSQAQDQLPTQAKMIAILNNGFISKKYNIIAQVKAYKVDAMVFCTGCSCKFNLRFIPYFLFLSSSCLFCSFQFAVRFSPPLLLVSCSRITKKHTCTYDELFILNLYVKEHDSKLQKSIS